MKDFINTVTGILKCFFILMIFCLRMIGNAITRITEIIIDKLKENDDKYTIKIEKIFKQ